MNHTDETHITMKQMAERYGVSLVYIYRHSSLDETFPKSIGAAYISTAGKSPFLYNVDEADAWFMSKRLFRARTKA